MKTFHNISIDSPLRHSSINNSPISSKPIAKVPLTQLNPTHNSCLDLHEGTKNIQQSVCKLDYRKWKINATNQQSNSLKMQVEGNKRQNKNNVATKANSSPGRRSITHRYQSVQKVDVPIKQLRSKRQIASTLQRSAHWLKLNSLNGNIFKIQHSHQKRKQTAKRQTSLTGTYITTSQLQTQQNANPQDKLYFYWNRNSLNPTKNIDRNAINLFFNNPEYRAHQFELNNQSRKFLLSKMKNDYRNHEQIHNYREQLARDKIAQELKHRLNKYRKMYTVRTDSPYLSFLSMSRNQRKNIVGYRSRTEQNSQLKQSEDQIVS